MAENFLKRHDYKVQEAQQTPSKGNLKRPTWRHVVIKLPKDKERVLKAAAKQIIRTWGPPRLPLDSSSETSEARRQWGDITNNAERKKFSKPRIL